MFGLMIWRRFRCGRWWSVIRAVDFGETNDIMMGCGFPEGEQGYNVGRNARLLAGIDHHVPAVTVSRFCASSLQTIRMAFHAIKAGEGDQYIAAGVECVSRGAAQTFPLMNHRIDGTNGTGYNVYISMGITAENVADPLQGHPRVSGRVGGAVPAAGAGGPRERPFRSRDRRRRDPRDA